MTFEGKNKPLLLLRRIVKKMNITSGNASPNRIVKK